MWKSAFCLIGLLALAGCGTRSSVSVAPAPGALPAAMAAAAKSPADIIVTPNDITDRKYASLGDISVAISKWTIFDADPTPADVNAVLREKAAEMGADAVVLTRYGTVSIGFASWGRLEGQGRAIAFEK